MQRTMKRKAGEPDKFINRNSNSIRSEGGTVESVYSSHPRDTIKWLVCRGGQLLIEIDNNNGQILINGVHQQGENKLRSYKVCNLKSMSACIGC